MTEFVDVAGGRIALDVRRQDYRFLAPTLAQAGYRVANADLRGHGDSSYRPRSGPGHVFGQGH